MPSVQKDLQITDTKPDSERSTLSSVSKAITDRSFADSSKVLRKDLAEETEALRSEGRKRDQWDAELAQIANAVKTNHSQALQRATSVVETSAANLK